MLWEGDGGSLQVRSQVREPQTLNSQLSTTAAKPKGRLGFRVTTNHCLCFLALPFAGARCQEGPPLGHVSLIYSSRKKREKLPSADQPKHQGWVWWVLVGLIWVPCLLLDKEAWPRA